VENPFLQVPNAYADVEMLQDMASREGAEFNRLCWEVFHVNQSGARLYELLSERYLQRATFNPADPQATNLALYWEGFKEAIRGLHAFGLQHIKYVNGVESNERRSSTIPSPSTPT
jgi:hypothetical protein